MSTVEALRPRLARFRLPALLAGILGLAVCGLVALASPERAGRTYLVGYLFWFGVSLGSLGILMLHHVVGGTWGWAIRRPLESAAMALWVLALLFVPILVGLRHLYPWADPAQVEALETLRQKAVYLNPLGFAIRAGVAFLVWFGLAYGLNRLSVARTPDGLETNASRLQALSAPGLVVLFLTGTFTMIDWGMSLEPDWTSTIYPVMLLVGHGLLAFAFTIGTITLLAGDDPARKPDRPLWYGDLGNLMLAFVMLWAYMSFSQYLIIWCGNLAEEIPWYLRRTRGGWEYVGATLIAFHFFLPFFALLFREVKREARRLLIVAGAVILMHLVDLTWLILPAFARESAPTIPWLDLPLVLMATLGVGGIWMAVYLGQLASRPIDLPTAREPAPGHGPGHPAAATSGGH